MNYKYIATLTAIIFPFFCGNAAAGPDDFVTELKMGKVCHGHVTHKPHLKEGKTISIARVKNSKKGEDYFIFEDPEEYGDKSWRKLKLRYVDGVKFSGRGLCQRPAKKMASMTVEEKKDLDKKIQSEIELNSKRAAVEEHLVGEVVLDHKQTHRVYVYVNGEDFYVYFPTIDGTIHAGHVHPTGD